MISRQALGILLLAFFCLAEPGHAEPDRGLSPGEPKQALIIGVRSMARPFSYKLPADVIATDSTRGPLGRAGYGGYMVSVCDAALAEMLVDPASPDGLTMEQVGVYDIDAGKQVTPPEVAEPPPLRADPRPPVKSAQKTGKNDGLSRPAASRFDDLGRKYDILCDPATVTNERRSFIVSPPVFLTGIGYLTLRNEQVSGNPCGTATGDTAKKVSTNTPGKADKPAEDSGKDIAATAGTEDRRDKPDVTNTARKRPEKPVRQGGTEPAKDEKSRALIGIVAGTTSRTRGIQALVDAREMPNFETQLIAELRREGEPACKDGKVLVREYASHEEAARKFCAGQEFYHYVGDLEIIRSYANAIPGCNFDNGSVTYTNDRYAVFGKAICHTQDSPPRTDPPPAAPDAGASSTSANLVRNPVERPCGAPDRQLRVARFFSVLTQKVIFNPSVLDKAYDDSFAGKPQSRKLTLFYWSIRGERLPDPQADAVRVGLPKTKKQ